MSITKPSNLEQFKNTREYKTLRAAGEKRQEIKSFIDQVQRKIDSIHSPDSTSPRSEVDTQVAAVIATGEFPTVVPTQQSSSKSAEYQLLCHQRKVGQLALSQQDDVEAQCRSKYAAIVGPGLRPHFAAEYRNVIAGLINAAVAQERLGEIQAELRAADIPFCSYLPVNIFQNLGSIKDPESRVRIFIKTVIADYPELANIELPEEAAVSAVYVKMDGSSPKVSAINARQVLERPVGRRRA